MLNQYKNTLNIIHISDTHISSKLADEANTIVNALVNDIKSQLSETELKSTIICFTGDLIQRGDYGYLSEKQYDLAIYNFILPLLEGLKIEQPNFFIIPGNHEIDKQKINEIYDKGLWDKLNTYKGDLIDYKKESILRERLDDYRKFENDLFGKVFSEDITNEIIFSVNDKKIGICLVNSSWLLKSDSQNEKGKIIIGKKNLLRSLSKFKDCDYRICLIHHSIEWLKDEDLYDSEMLFGEFDVVLCGHSHHSIGKQTVSPNGKTVYCMASILTPISDATGYNILKINNNECSVFQRKFFSMRNSFDLDLSVKGGHCTFSIRQEDNQSIIYKTCLKTKRGFEEKSNNHSLSSLINDCKSFSDIYVEPSLTYEDESTSVGLEKEKIKLIKITDIIDGKEHFVIYGKKEYGKTMLLFHIARQYYNTYDIKFLPLIIDCKKIGKRVSSVYEQLKSYISDISDPDFALSKNDLNKILDSGNCILMFDNFDINTPQDDIVSEFIKQHPLNKRIFTTTPTLSKLLEDKFSEWLNKDVSNNYKKVHINYMSKNDIRRLATNLTTCSQDEMTLFTSRIITCFNKTYLPRTPFAVSLVVSVCNINADFEPVNLAAVVRRFLEIVMDRLSPKELLSNEFNFDIKEDFLSFLAFKMVETNTYVIPIETFDQWLREYHDYNGFSLRESHFDEYFFACQVLINNHGNVSFKYQCLLEYYIGKKASIDDIFLNKILQKDKCLNFTQELSYCTGLNTRDKTVLDKLGGYLKESISTEDIDTSFLSGDKIGLDFSISDDEIKLKVVDKQMSISEADCATDLKDNSDEYLPSEIDKHSQSDIENYDLLLMTFGNAVRNTELSGFENKYEAFKLYIQGILYWCSVIIKSIDEFIPTIKKEIFEKNSNVHDAKFDMQKAEETFRDLVKIIVPCLAESNMFEHLGSKKLGKIFISYYTSNEDYSSLDKFLTLLLCLDLKVTRWQELLENFIANCKSKDLFIILFVKMVTHYKFCHFGKNNNEYLTKKLFEIKQKFDKNTMKEFGKNKTQFLSQLKKEQIWSS